MSLHDPRGGGGVLGLNWPRKQCHRLRCPMCLSEEESVDHLLLHGVVAHKIWNMLLDSFQCSWVLHHTINDLYQTWSLPFASPKGKILWSLSFAIIWTLWKERNQLSFEGNSSSSEYIFFRMRICTAHWVSTLPEFWGLQSNIILFN